LRSLTKTFRNGLHPAVLVPDWVAYVTPATLRADAAAGLTGATLVLPQGIAFAAIAVRFCRKVSPGFLLRLISPLAASKNQGRSTGHGD
jgi:SulP family sulfate permease